MAEVPPEVGAQVESIRKKLLDLTLRNRMLSFRPSKKASVEVVGESAFQVYKFLVEGGKKMAFTGLPDPRPHPLMQLELGAYDDAVTLQALEQQSREELDAYLDNPAMPVDQMDTKLATRETVSVLEAKLRHIWREARIAQEELGVNTLFLALGSLEWRDEADKPRQAPLVFVPTVLEKQRNNVLKVAYDGSDVGTNLPLRAKLKELNLDLPELEDDDTLLDYFEKVEATVRHKENWTVHRDAIHLAFFNYEKYVMWRDLGGENWPEGRKPWQHPELAKLLGQGYAPIDSPITEATQLDTVRPPIDCHEVYNADSSQTLVIMRALEGYSLVVQGPPGTGKSQTITNLIAEAAAAGKRVLFVSAKRAALDVVRRRLEDADLHDLCLDLHDRLTNRKAFYGELKRTANLNFRIKDQEDRVLRLTEVQHQLNEHSEAVNTPLEPFGLTPFDAMIRLAKLPQETVEDRPGRIEFALLQHLMPRDVLAAVGAVGSLQQCIAQSGLLDDNPYRGCTLSFLDPGTRLDLEQAALKAQSALQRAQEAIARAAGHFRVAPPRSARETRVLQACAERANAAPRLVGVAVSAGTWSQEEPSIRAAIAAIRQHQQCSPAVEGAFLQGSLEADLTPVEAAYRAHAPKLFKFLIGEYRQAKAQLGNCLAPGAPTDPVDRLALLEQHRLRREAQSEVLRLQPLMESLFGVQYQGLASSPELLETLLAWVLGVQADVQNRALPDGILEFFADFEGDGDPLGLAAAANEAADAAIATYGEIARTLGFDASSAAEEPLAELSARVEGWGRSLPRLSEYIHLLEARRQVAEKGLQALVEVSDRWPLAGSRLIDTLLRSYYSGILRTAVEHRPALKNFERHAQESAVREFRELDDFKLVYNRARIRLTHLRQLPDFAVASGNLMLLRTQCELQRRHRSIRWAMEKAGAAIQKIKPVFMMSPLSVAIHLPPELPPFDMVIFDEASQVKPEDALSAIIRANQAIVVGDTRQMPPTSFFDRLFDDEEEGDEEDASLVVAQETAKLESILSMMSVVSTDRARRPDLRWHYRSLHPSLIQPSNEMFYDNRLVIFPSPSRIVRDREVGVRFHHHPDTAYAQGRRVNVKEAQIVADAVVAHLRAHPEESLLVAAMNKSQADLIDDQIEIQRRLQPDLFAAFDQRHGFEPLAVKNLENVQGDERDVVYISVTYGRDEAGILRQQFGPLLLDGGERRLNVLITRARLRCEVFSNFTASDLRADPGRRGLFCFQQYLKYAETGELEVHAPTGLKMESPFEEEVERALRQHGYEAHAQVGCEAYRIDLCVVDPEAPGRYLLGIECDGASYHSARSARDRDKLRQQVLESRGWRLHRIWSTDWWRDRDSEIERLLEAVEEARRAPSAPKAPPAEGDDFVEELAESRRPKVHAAPYPSVPASPFVSTVESLESYAVEVVRREGPIAKELLLLRLRDAAGSERLTKKLRQQLEPLVERAVAAGHFTRFRDAFVTSDLQAQVFRDWSGRPTSERRVDNLTDVEFLAALAKIVRTSFGVTPEEAVQHTWRMLGFGRVSKVAMDRGAALVEEIVAQGLVDTREGLLVPRVGSS